jgi:putative ATP-dependent endonuclease of OLD family
MYLAKMHIENFRCFGGGDQGFDITFNHGLTALVGENDAGKSAIIDAIRLALGTTDQEWFRIEDSDFYQASDHIEIICRFEDLSTNEKSAFIEYLTYGKTENDITLTLMLSAKRSLRSLHGRPYHTVETRTGDDGLGPALDQNARFLLQATYLRPLRDAEQALSSGRGSRFAQILNNTEDIRTKGESNYKDGCDIKQLNVLGISRLINSLLKQQTEVVSEKKIIDSNLSELALASEKLECDMGVSGENAQESFQRLQLLEKLDLTLNVLGRSGLGSDNLLFMACELILLKQDDDANKLLLIEEPEAHLHPQRQLQVMQYLQDRAKKDNIQIIITTHSPNLASVISLDNMLVIHNRRAFPLKHGQTRLLESDYAFLERFLDVTKANLFFAKSVLIVEGDAENILIPTLANALGKDFTRNGVSIVNVGGVGLGRYARIFQRSDDTDQINIPVACITDMDVMPDCAPAIIGKLGEDGVVPQNRKWRMMSDFKDTDALQKEREKKENRVNGQHVKTFVSDKWTFEYDLAYSGLPEDLYICACLAEEDEKINDQEIRKGDVIAQASQEFSEIEKKMGKEELCSSIYAKFVRGRSSKAITAQYLAERLRDKFDHQGLTAETLRRVLPSYIVAAIDYVVPTIGEAER